MAAPWSMVAQLRIVGQMHGSETNNVMHFGTNVVINDGDTARTLLTELCEAMLACVRDTLLPAVTQDWTLLRVEAKGIYQFTSDWVVVTATPADVGALGPTSVSFASTLVNVRSGQGGRRGRGRWFLPPAGEANITASDIDEAVMVLLAQFLLCIAGKFIGAAKTENWELGILSRTDLGGIAGNFDAALRPALSLNPVARVACMRSRKKGHGV